MVFDGLTGTVEFDPQGLRSNISVEILSVQSFDTHKKEGVWTSEGDPRINLVPPEISGNRSAEFGPISNKTFRVIIALVNEKTILHDCFCSCYIIIFHSYIFFFRPNRMPCSRERHFHCLAMIVSKVTQSI